MIALPKLLVLALAFLSPTLAAALPAAMKPFESWAITQMEAGDTFVEKEKDVTKFMSFHLRDQDHGRDYVCSGTWTSNGPPAGWHKCPGPANSDTFQWRVNAQYGYKSAEDFTLDVQSING